MNPYKLAHAAKIGVLVSVHDFQSDAWRKRRFFGSILQRSAVEVFRIGGSICPFSRNG